MTFASLLLVYDNSKYKYNIMITTVVDRVLGWNTKYYMYYNIVVRVVENSRFVLVRS